MKRLLFATILGISALATRADFEDKDSPNANINSVGLEYNGVFNLVTSDLDAGPNSVGFLPGSTVNDATAKFELEANGNFVMKFDIFLDTFLFAQGQTPANGGVTINQLIDGIGGNEAAILAALSDGVSNYKVVRTDTAQGTLRVKTGDLTVSGSDIKLPPDSVPTPDAGSTLALAGIGFAAIASLRKKIAR